MKSDIPHTPRDAAWERLAEAGATARKHLPERDDSAPFGFATRIVSRWKAMQREERLRLLQRWSFRAALASLGLLVIVALWEVNQSRTEDSPAPLDVPQLNLSVP